VKRSLISLSLSLFFFLPSSYSFFIPFLEMEEEFKGVSINFGEVAGV
jgi:hypothetical protein